MDVSLAQDDVLVAADVDLIAILRTSMARTFGPTAMTSAQVNLRPICAVAGMRIPPVLRRSPSRASMLTRIRSFIILIGRRSCWLPAGPGTGWSLRVLLTAGTVARDRVDRTRAIPLKVERRLRVGITQTWHLRPMPHRSERSMRRVTPLPRPLWHLRRGGPECRLPHWR